MRPDLIENIKSLFSKFTEFTKLDKLTLSAEFSEFLKNELEANNSVAIKNLQTKTSEVSRANTLSTQATQTSFDNTNEAQEINVHHFAKVKFDFRKSWNPNFETKYSVLETAKLLRIAKNLNIFRNDGHIITQFLCENKCRSLLLSLKSDQLSNLESFIEFLINFKAPEILNFEQKFLSASQRKNESFRSFAIRIERYFRNWKEIQDQELSQDQRRQIEIKFRQGLLSVPMKYSLTDVKCSGDLESIISKANEIKLMRSLILENDSEYENLQTYDYSKTQQGNYSIFAGQIQSTTKKTIRTAKFKRIKQKRNKENSFWNTHPKNTFQAFNSRTSKL